MPRQFRVILAVSLAVSAAAAFAPRPRPERRDAAPQAASATCEFQTAERVVAVGDVHGAFDRFVKILQEAALIDGRRRWIGGRAVLVQAGDFHDRGPDSGKVIELMRKLEGEAARAGGRVHVLLGNHEAMRVLGDYRYVSAGEYAAFRSPQAEDLRGRYLDLLVDSNKQRTRAAGEDFDERAFRQKFLKDTPLGFVEMQLAYGPQGELGKWLRGLNAVIKINGVVFLHGGPTTEVAALGCATINGRIRTELDTLRLSSPELSASLIGGPSGPLWYRGLAEDDSGVTAADVDATLKSLDARAIVIGHTIAPGFRIRMRFGGRVVQIDTGILGGDTYPGGVASALEIHGDRWTAIYEGRREPVVPQRPAQPGQTQRPQG